jgi:hypothetical protein
MEILCRYIEQCRNTDAQIPRARTTLQKRFSRAKTPSSRRKIFLYLFSLGVLCAFARGNPQLFVALVIKAAGVAVT